MTRDIIGMAGALAALIMTAGAGAQVPAAVGADPPADAAHPASMQVVHIPTHGVEINGVLYQAAGAGPHPTMVLYHGLPGNEQNLDLAQAVRRDGWNVLTLHYRGSWGSPGTYSFTHVFEDAQAALDFVRDPAVAQRYGVDRRRLVVAGHSLGGMAAAEVGAHNPDLAGVVLISAANMGRIGETRGGGDREKLAAFMAQNNESLATTPQAMADEAIAHARDWDFITLAGALSRHPLLVVTSDDGLGPTDAALAAAVRAAHAAPVSETHLATDHSYSGMRIALEAAVIGWLDALPAAR